MTNYYHILGIDKSASAAQIKSAFKKLAVKYHPDKNIGNKASEEIFKRVNEAYQILGNDESRRRYDLQLEYISRTHTVVDEYRKANQTKEKTVYDRYGRYNWRTAPKYKTAPVYKIDRHYYRNIIISFLMIGIMALTSVGIARYHQKSVEEEELILKRQMDTLLKAAQNYYDNGDYQKALKMVSDLSDEFPMEFRFYEKKETLIDDMGKAAIWHFEDRNYEEAISLFELLADHQRPVRLSNYRLMAKCYLQLKDYGNAAHVYEFIIERDPNNVELMLETAQLYQLAGNEQKVLDYYNEARYTFKKFQERSYGAAFEFVIDPNQLPELYYNMFENRAELLIKNETYEEAIKDCNWGIYMRPDRPYLYYLRAKAKSAMGQTNRACLDLNRAIERGFKKQDIKFTNGCFN